MKDGDIVNKLFIYLFTYLLFSFETLYILHYKM